MNYDWIVPRVAELKPGEKPNAVFPVVLLPVLIVGGVIITLLTWQTGKNIMQPVFFARALGVPLLLWGQLCGLHYGPCEKSIHDTNFWNWLCRTRLANWRRWTQKHLAVIDTKVITPVEDLPERMLGLEGDPPSNAGQALRLEPQTQDAEAQQGVASAIDDSAIEASAETSVVVHAGIDEAELLERLITPFSGYLTRSTKDDEVYLTVHAQSVNVPLLRGILARIGVKRIEHIKIVHAAPEDMTSSPLHWLKTRRGSYGQEFGLTLPDLCLMIAYQLHGKAADCTEIAAATLCASPSAIQRYKLKPKARIFRTIEVSAEEIPRALDSLVAAAQTAPERIKHLWLSNLPKQARHMLTGSLKDAGLELQVHDLDKALGKPGTATPHVIQALAAQMVGYGQGAHLVAMPCEKGVSLNVVDAKLSAVPYIANVSIPIFPVFSTLGTLCGFTLISWLWFELNAPAAMWWITSIFFVALLALFPLGALWFIPDDLRHKFNSHLPSGDEE
jgi:hypothetical protein